MISASEARDLQHLAGRDWEMAFVATQVMAAALDNAQHVVIEASLSHDTIVCLRERLGFEVTKSRNVNGYKLSWR